MEKNKIVVKFYNSISTTKVDGYTDIPYEALRFISFIPMSALAIPLCVDMLDRGKSYNQIKVSTGLTISQIRVVAAKVK